MSRDDVVLCASCKAEIVFLRTPANKKMPVNADTVQDTDDLYEHGRHVSHWSTCTHADRHRKRLRPVK